jgi:hypothetical protein
MPEVELSLHVPLGILFLVAGVAKIARRGEWREAVHGYRLAQPPALVAWLVPAAEAAIGTALVAGMAAAGWAALAFLAMASAALAVELAAGTPPPACGCLLPSVHPPGPLTLVRNGLISAVAAAVALGVTMPIGETFWVASTVALWIVVAGLLVLVLALYRQVGVLHLRLGPRGAFEHDGESLPLGASAPEGLARTLLVFTSETCPVCRQILPGLRALASDHGVTVLHARQEDVDGLALHDAFEVPGTPYAVYVGKDGLVRSKGAVNTLEQLEGLVATGRRREREGVVGHAA